jgi:hypothetical protein
LVNVEDAIFLVIDLFEKLAGLHIILLQRLGEISQQSPVLVGGGLRFLVSVPLLHGRLLVGAGLATLRLACREHAGPLVTGQQIFRGDLKYTRHAVEELVVELRQQLLHAVEDGAEVAGARAAAVSHRVDSGRVDVAGGELLGHVVGEALGLG